LEINTETDVPAKDTQNVSDEEDDYTPDMLLSHDTEPNCPQWSPEIKARAQVSN